MQTRFIKTIDAVDATSWNGLLNDDNPFLDYRFLAALEASKVKEKIRERMKRRRKTHKGEHIVQVCRKGEEERPSSWKCHVFIN